MHGPSHGGHSCGLHVPPVPSLQGAGGHPRAQFGDNLQPRWGLEPCVPMGSPARGCQQPKSPAPVPGAAPGALGHAVPVLRSHPDLPITHKPSSLGWEPSVLEKNLAPGAAECVEQTEPCTELRRPQTLPPLNRNAAVKGTGKKGRETWSSRQVAMLTAGK